jgi:vacuolar-type H+-ATPase subunit H
MSLDAIQKVAEVEKLMQARRAAADAEARQLVSNAEQEALVHLQKVRAEAAEQGKHYLQEAEKKAKARAADIQSAVIVESDALRQEAEKHLDEAAELIVRRVVNR